MLVRPKLASLFAALVASASLMLSGCSSSSPRDINYGTDVGLGFVPPDVPPATTATDSAATDAEVSADSADAVDGKGLVDAPIDASIDDAAADAEDSAGPADAVDGGVLVDASADGDS